MRNLEEYKEEIMKRSEEKIKRRNRMRTRVLSLCVPLLCATAIVGVYAIPHGRANAMPEMEQETCAPNAGGYETFDFGCRGTEIVTARPAENLPLIPGNPEISETETKETTETEKTEETTDGNWTVIK